MQELDSSVREVIKSTTPQFLEKSHDITTRMYEVLFENHPEVKPMFDNAPNNQPRMFAGALHAHLISLDDPSVLDSFRVPICRKHTHAGVKKEHYPFIYEAFRQAMKEKLGTAATDEMLDAWQKWVEFLGNKLIEREAEFYKTGKPF